MPDKQDSTRNGLRASLKARAKELDCLYWIERKLQNPEQRLDDVLPMVLRTIRPGMSHPEITRGTITLGETIYRDEEGAETEWSISEDICVQGEVVGTVCVYYTEERPPAEHGPFLKEEIRLLHSIADRLGHYILFQQLQAIHKNYEDASAVDQPEAWRSTVRLLRASDRSFYLKIARKILNYLYSMGIREASELLHGTEAPVDMENVQGEINVPGKRQQVDAALLLSDAPFEVAAKHLSGETILALVQKWLQEDKAAFFIKVLANPRSSLPEIAEVVRRYQNLSTDGGLPDDVLGGLRVSLARRFFTEQLDFIKVAKDYLDLHDYEWLIDRLIMPSDSHGKLGGKSAGILLAHQILTDPKNADRGVGEVRLPRSRYLSSDGILDFISRNDLEDVIEQKFKEIGQVRYEYPNIVQLFKDSTFPNEIVMGLSHALDEFGDSPLIIRSSSLLEDRLGTAFSGKYKSLFLANQGDKQVRLSALLDAIAEVYASVFGPDPIEYRRERGLLEFSEEMGILIQEVVGRRVGRFFLPAFAGVAFSNNEFRWSPRINRKDGIIRMVPGLGTRAVDRLSDDYPALLVPGQPKLRANVAIDEIVRYSPRMLDVIDLESNSLVTVKLDDLFREVGKDIPGLSEIYSVLDGGILRKPVPLMIDAEKDHLIATFEGLFADRGFVSSIRSMLNLLEEKLGTPVDLEFAHDGQHFHLLQCRPQSFSVEDAPSPIPRDVEDADVIFSASRYVSNGLVPDITHIVYVDPDGYSRLPERSDLLGVARAVGQLNKLLPKRQFLLMGPGRWGSRGDIRLGVPVTYADISNSAMLIEIARERGGYVPDLSFGTHFFQDLVEARIRYLPLYPDDEGIVFNELFLVGSQNMLAELVPEFAHLAAALRVIDVAAEREGRRLRVLLNADLDEALAHLVPAEEQQPLPKGSVVFAAEPKTDYWPWRLRMAEHIAARLDGERFGVRGMYVFGSAKNGTAGPGSDIDLLVHFAGSEAQREELTNWLEGWSLCLAEVNFFRTGHKCDALLDVHLVTDADIAAGDSYAAKIGAATDPARELRLGSGVRK